VLVGWLVPVTACGPKSVAVLIGSNGRDRFLLWPETLFLANEGGMLLKKWTAWKAPERIRNVHEKKAVTHVCAIVNQNKRGVIRTFPQRTSRPLRLPEHRLARPSVRSSLRLTPTGPSHAEKSTNEPRMLLKTRDGCGKVVADVLSIDICAQTGLCERMGRAWQGDNMNTGSVTLTDTAYPETVEATSTVRAEVNRRWSRK